MAENKTKPTSVTPTMFIASQLDERVRSDCDALVSMMQAVTNAPAVMWGASIIGFGAYHYKYASGREGDMPRLGFSPRKSAFTLYTMSGWDVTLLPKLGKHTVGTGCLYIKKLSDVNAGVLQDLLKRSLEGYAALEAANAEIAPKPASGKTKPKKIDVCKPNDPSYAASVDAEPYQAMKKALLKALPKKSPGLTQTDLFAELVPHLPRKLFPGGRLVSWWAQCVHADLEARGITVKESGRPARWHQA